jgi:arsenate reductase-like glutaredoxin family protein
VKASKFLEARGVEVTDTVSASKKLGEKEARGLIREARSIVVAKGKKLDEFEGGKASKEIVEKMLGTTGNLRAPTIVVGDKLVVGFNEEVYAKVLG